MGPLSLLELTTDDCQWEKEGVRGEGANKRGKGGKYRDRNGLGHSQKEANIVAQEYRLESLKNHSNGFVWEPPQKTGKWINCGRRE